MLSAVLREIPLVALIDLKYGMLPFSFISEATNEIKTTRFNLREWDLFMPFFFLKRYTEKGKLKKLNMIFVVRESRLRLLDRFKT